MVKNHHKAKSISDASWSMFVDWVEYFAKLHKVAVVAVPPHYTSQDCSACGNRVKKTLSTRTHQCSKCGLKMHRDHNAAQNILVKGLEVLGVKISTGGQPGTQACGENHLWLVEGNFGSCKWTRGNRKLKWRLLGISLYNHKRIARRALEGEDVNSFGKLIIDAHLI